MCVCACVCVCVCCFHDYFLGRWRVLIAIVFAFNFKFTPEVLFCQCSRKELTQKLETTDLPVISQAGEVFQSIVRGAVLHIQEHTG